MPLLGRKVVHLVKPLTNVDPNETIYTIPHTKEQFRSKAEYEKRLAQYNESVWTCQCSGHINMTHEDAYRSEQEKYTILRDQFPKYLEKTVLELVHHSTEILDNLVDQSWTKIQQAFLVDETVALKAKVQGKVIRGKVVRVDTSEVDTPQKNGLPNGNCNSPSSDKENAASNNTEGAKSESQTTPTKWVHPKVGSPCVAVDDLSEVELLEYKYNLKLEDEDKTISGIPAYDLQRVQRPPSKDLVKLFIRSHALRHGTHPNSPWVVSEELVKAYSLKSKFADFMVSPSKMAEVSKKVGGENNRKRKASVKEEKPIAKRQKLTAKSPKQTQLTMKTPDGQPKKRGRPPKSANSTPKGSPQKKATPKKTPQKSPAKKSPTKAAAGSSSSSMSSSSDSDSGSDSDNSEDVALADLKKSAPSTPKSKQGTPRKRSLADIKREMEENVPLSHLKSPNGTPQLNADGTPKKKRGRPPKPKEPKEPKKRGRPKKDASNTPGQSPTKSVKKSPTKSAAKSPARKPRTPKKGMKQITLFDMKGKGKGKTPGTPTKSPAKSQAKSPRKPQTPVKLPPIVTKLRKAFKTKNNSHKEKCLYTRLLITTAEKLTKKQQAILPDDIKISVLEKIEALEEKKKLKKMTPEQREEYMKQKRKENAKKKAKVEDTHLDLQPLPMPKLVPTPDGIANELFGDIVMLTEFINCYKGLILPEDTRVFNANEAMKSLAGGEDSFLYLGQMLQVLLQTLLQDGIAQDYKELGMALANITVTPYGTAELVRLCLRDNDEDPSDDDDGDSEDSDTKGQHDEVPADLVEQLETSELWALTPEEKLAVLKGLCHRMMSSYSVQDYMVQCQQTATDLWRRRIKEGLSKAKLEKIRKTKEELEEPKEEPVEEEQKPGMTLKDFYGSAPPAEESLSDLASVVKRRRVMAARAVEEKRRRDEVEKKRREKEYDEQRKQRELENFEKEFVEGLLTAKLVLRQTPIGTDRDHNRYWQFLGAAPGIYVEKGWAPPEMEYHVGPKKESWESSDSDSDSDSESEVTRGRKPREHDLKREKTAPRVGQNLWFLYDNLSDILSLMDRLHPKGVRENNLLTNLKKLYPNVEAEFQRRAKLKEKEKDKSDEPESESLATSLQEGMRQDLLDVEMRLRNGGLGGVDNFTDWEKNMNKAKTIQEFGALMIETQTYVPGKFLKGFLGPEGMSKKKDSKKTKEEEEEGDEEKEAEEDIHAGVERWKEAIQGCTTFSRLHVLLGMLDSCIQWERSVENAKCKVCRKKGDEFLLCDECNQPFHLYCLRPALPCIPEGDWFCPACLPSTQRRNSRNKDYRRMAEGSDSSEAESDESGSEQEEEEEVEEADPECTVCGGDEGLITCSSCPSSFHLDCHQPPLRREPRSIWKCQQCVTGVRIRKAKAKPSSSSRPQRSARNRKAYTYDEDDSSEEEEDEEEEEEEEDEESETESSRPARRSSTSRSGRGQKKPSYKEEDEEEDEEEEEEEEEGEEDDEESGSESDEAVPETGKGRRTSSSKASFLLVLKNLVTRLRRHKCSWPFLDPVDKEAVPDYYDIVKNPISLQDMKVKIEDEDYDSPQEFVDDMALLFDNADLYNKRDSTVGQCIEPLEKAFTDLMEKHIPHCQYKRDTEGLQKAINNHYSSETEESDTEEEEESS